jgi:hypothetical protein
LLPNLRGQPDCDYWGRPHLIFAGYCSSSHDLPFDIILSATKSHIHHPLAIWRSHHV